MSTSLRTSSVFFKGTFLPFVPEALSAIPFAFANEEAPVLEPSRVQIVARLWFIYCPRRNCVTTWSFCKKREAVARVLPILTVGGGVNGRIILKRVLGYWKWLRVAWWCWTLWFYYQEVYKRIYWRSHNTVFQYEPSFSRLRRYPSRAWKLVSLSGGSLEDSTTFVHNFSFKTSQ
jgi:hypothetical protein